MLPGDAASAADAQGAGDAGSRLDGRDAVGAGSNGRVNRTAVILGSLPGYAARLVFPRTCGRDSNGRGVATRRPAWASASVSRVVGCFRPPRCCAASLSACLSLWIPRLAGCRSRRDPDLQPDHHERSVSTSRARTLAGHQQHRLCHGERCWPTWADSADNFS